MAARCGLIRSPMCGDSDANQALPARGVVASHETAASGRLSTFRRDGQGVLRIVERFTSKVSNRLLEGSVV